ncbi:MAG TPA: hypothetical protein PLP17_07785 [Oligoflexia bacterium]|nr:hypothetical protein [Oligoflexia bacterium]
MAVVSQGQTNPSAQQNRSSEDENPAAKVVESVRSHAEAFINLPIMVGIKLTTPSAGRYRDAGDAVTKVMDVIFGSREYSELRRADGWHFGNSCYADRQKADIHAHLARAAKDLSLEWATEKLIKRQDLSRDIAALVEAKLEVADRMAEATEKRVQRGQSPKDYEDEMKRLSGAYQVFDKLMKLYRTVEADATYPADRIREDMREIKEVCDKVE